MKSLRFLSLAALPLALAACVSLFPKADPSQLYRFGPRADAAEPTPSQGVRTSVALARISFNQSASGDRILTYTGSEAAYVKGARWVEPADAMFERSLQSAFETKASAVRLVDRRQASATTAVLDVDVDVFETRYEAGPKGAPTVVVSFSARLVRYPDRAVIGERRFTARKTASDNRMGAIVPAYDAALDDALGQLVAWTDETAGRR